MTLGRLWDDFWSTLGRLLADLGSTVGRLWADSGLTLGQLWANLGLTLGRLCADFGPNLGRLWANPKPFRGHSVRKEVLQKQNRRGHLLPRDGCHMPERKMKAAMTLSLSMVA